MSCRTQFYDGGNVLRLVSDTDGMEWVLLFHEQRGTAELIPLNYSADSDKKLALWSKKKTINFRFNPVNEAGPA